ncbi:MAG: NusG domain II-containing protein, partial [Oscillospiraceae bacterium]|nr:NusG domain II-containing protein [Oscillospiraceae bacterium]
MENKLFKKKEIVLLLIISALMLAMILLPALKKNGKGARAIVTCNGDVVAEIDLGKDADYTIEGALTATLEVRNGKIRF